MYGSNEEPVCFRRDCEAVAIPSGEAVILPKGVQGTLIQALGGSFTVYVDGNLYRIGGNDADAIGKEPIESPNLPARRIRRRRREACMGPDVATASILKFR